MLLAVLAAASAMLRADQKSGTLDVYWVDSEGGGSTLIVTPANESVLIDTGHPGGRDAPRIAKAVREAGLTQMDRLIVTHFHGDHYGAAAEIADLLPIRVIHERAIPEADPDGKTASTWPVLSKPYRELKVERRERLAPGVNIPLRQAGGLELALRCLGADQVFVEPTAAQKQTRNPLTGTLPPKPKDTSDNANSAVFLLTFGAFRLFDGGDLTWNLEEKLVTPYNLVGAVDVYQTNHHGLDQSNNPLLVHSLDPIVVVMNNGPRKGGQPGSFAAIRSTRSLQGFYQLHQSFNVPLADNQPDEWVANFGDRVGPEAQKCTAHVIKLSVAPDGKSYTISIPAKGHARTFRTRQG